MRICDLHTGAGRLQRAANDLRDCWLATREVWSDARCRQFEEEFLQPLAPLLNQVSAAVSRYRELIEQAEQALSDDEAQELL